MKNSVRIVASGLIAFVFLSVATISSVADIKGSRAAGPGYNFRIIAKLGNAAPGGGTHEGDFEPQEPPSVQRRVRPPIPSR